MGELVGQATEHFLNDLTCWRYLTYRLRTLTFGLVEVTDHLNEGHLGVTEEIRKSIGKALDRLVSLVAFKLYALKLSWKLMDSFMVGVVLSLNVCCNLVELGYKVV